MMTTAMKTAEDKQINFSEINRAFREVADCNGWRAYHTPKNIASAISVEANELLAEFQWLTAEESAQLTQEQHQRVSNEIADVLMYLSELCEQLQINPAEAVANKIRFNRTRFVKS